MALLPTWSPRRSQAHPDHDQAVSPAGHVSCPISLMTKGESQHSSKQNSEQPPSANTESSARTKSSTLTDPHAEEAVVNEKKALESGEESPV
jgi:hypothetical protein